MTNTLNALDMHSINMPNWCSTDIGNFLDGSGQASEILALFLDALVSQDQINLQVCRPTHMAFAKSQTRTSQLKKHVFKTF